MMKWTWLIIVAALFALTVSVALAGEAMPGAPAPSGKTMDERKGGGMGMQMEDKDKKMEGTEGREYGHADGRQEDGRDRDEDGEEVSARLALAQTADGHPG